MHPHHVQATIRAAQIKRPQIKLNVMDNQASKVIKNYVTLQNCGIMLIEPNNHRVKAAKQAIQTFKAHFISALASTDSEFPLQLWDRLTLQVENTLNMPCHRPWHYGGKHILLNVAIY
jgi:hypothetical protein